MRLRLRVSACSLLVLSSASCGGPSEPPPSGRVMWTVAEAGGLVPVTDQQTVYFFSPGHEVIAVNKMTGSVRWRAATDAAGQLGGTNLLLVGDLVVVPDVSLYAFDRATGARKWVFQPADGDRPGFRGISTDGSSIFAGSQTARVYAVDAATGQQKWAVPIDAIDGSATAFSPAVHNGVVYVGLKRFTTPATGALVALDASTGAEVWTHTFVPELSWQASGSLGGAVSHGGLVYASPDDGRIYAFDAVNGDVAWVSSRVVVDGDPDRTIAGDQRPLAIIDGLVIAGSLTSEDVAAYDAVSGELAWQESPRMGGTMSPLVAHEGTVFVHHLGGQLTALDATNGRVLWTDDAGPFGDPKYSAAPTAESDRLYASGWDALWALRR